VGDEIGHRALGPDGLSGAALRPLRRRYDTFGDEPVEDALGPERKDPGDGVPSIGDDDFLTAADPVEVPAQVVAQL
jgi:hypothetical protein